MRSKKLKTISIALFLSPVFLAASIFLYYEVRGFMQDLIITYRTTPYESVYAEGTFQAYGKTFYDRGEGHEEVEIEVSYQLEFQYYRTYSTGMTGKFIINGKEYPGRTEFFDQTPAQRLAQKRSGLSSFSCYLEREPAGPFSPPTSPAPALFADVVLEENQPVYWEITLLDDYAEVRGVFYGPATSWEEYLAIYDIFGNLN